MYTIRKASTRSGVPAALLRAWERRYGVVRPKRTPGGYRLYDDEAIERLRAMRRLVDAGWSASTAAGAILSGEPLPAEAMEAAAERERFGQLDRAGQGDLGGALVSGAAELDLELIESSLDAMFAAGSFERVADDLLLPALVEVGAAWADGRVSVAGEHAASHAVLRRLSAAFQAGGRPMAGEGGVLVGLPPGARHELGALAFAIAARRAGLPVLYLGPDLPLQDWVESARNVRAEAAVIGAVTADDAPRAAAVGRAIAAARPGCVVAFGGRASDIAARQLEPDLPVLVLPDGLVNAVERLRLALTEGG